MSVYMQKNGLLHADGTGINDNLVLDSALDSTTHWSQVGSGWEVVEKNGYRCFHCPGGLKKVNLLEPYYSTTNTNKYTPAPNETIVMSAFVLLDNIVLGDTNSYLYFHGASKKIDGVTVFPTLAFRSDTFITHAGYECFDPAKTSDWTYAYVAWTYGDYDWSGICPNLFLRDFTGDFYIRDFKIEVSDHPTPWIPSTSDSPSLTITHGFLENGLAASIGKGFVEGNEFYEY